MARFWCKDAAGTTVELTAYIDQGVEWALQERAEQGAAGQSTITVNDRNMTLDLTGHLAFWVTEPTSEATDDLLFGGFAGGQVIGRLEATEHEPQGRVWALTVHDANAVWNRRVMVGSDCNRDDETDVQRVQWLFTTAESGIFDDVTTYVSTANPVDMDEYDYRRKYRDEVISSASLDGDKNWWCQYQETGTGRELVAWYGREGVAAYDSPLYLTNDPTEWADAQLADGTSVTWPFSDDTKLERDPLRVYTGGLAEYKRGAVYRKVVGATFRRDTIIQLPHVKRKAKAIAILERKLAKLADPELILRITVELPAAKATMIRAGMRIQIKATHLPGVTDWSWWRILNCTIRPVPGADRYRLTLECTDTGVAASGPPAVSLACILIGASLTAAGTYFGNGSATTQSPGNLFYTKPSVDAPWVPTTGFVGQWNFPDYANDAAGDAVENSAIVIVAGPGTLTLTVANYAGSAHTFNAEIQYDGSPGIHSSFTGLAAGAHAFTIPDDEHCYHRVRIYDDASVSGGKWQFVSWTWAPA